MPGNRFTIEEKLQCAVRECVQRKRVYARLVREGRMAPDKARTEYFLMKAIAEDYQRLLDQANGRQGGLFETTSKHNDQG